MIVENKGLGIAPLLIPAVAAGGVLLWEGARQAWEAFGPTPDIAVVPQAPPVAPTRTQLEEQLRTGRQTFTPGEMFERTIDVRRAQQAAATRVRRVEGQPPHIPRPADDTFLWLMGAGAVVLLVLLVK